MDTVTTVVVHRVLTNEETHPLQSHAPSRELLKSQTRVLFAMPKSLE